MSRSRRRPRRQSEVRFGRKRMKPYSADKHKGELKFVPEKGDGNKITKAAKLAAKNANRSRKKSARQQAKRQLKKEID